MKAKAIILAVIACMMLSSCNRVETAKGEDDTSMFVIVETTTFWDVVYHKDTKVMYVVSTGSNNHGTFTLLVDADGKPRCIMNKKQDNLDYAKGYGKNYADLRKKEYNHVKDYTVRELAVELLISSSTISKIENEKVYPTVEQVKAYKKFFHVSLDYLTGETKVCRTDLQMICEYTGLSEAAVRKLHKFATAGVEYGDSLYIKL